MSPVLPGLAAGSVDPAMVAVNLNPITDGDGGELVVLDGANYTLSDVEGRVSLRNATGRRVLAFDGGRPAALDGAEPNVREPALPDAGRRPSTGTAPPSGGCC